MNRSARQDSQTEMSHSGIPKNKTKLEFTEEIQFCLRMPCVGRHIDTCACWWNYNEKHWQHSFKKLILWKFHRMYFDHIQHPLPASPSSIPTFQPSPVCAAHAHTYTLGCVVFRWSTVALSTAAPLKENGLSSFSTCQSLLSPKGKIYYLRPLGNYVSWEKY